MDGICFICYNKIVNRIVFFINRRNNRKKENERNFTKKLHMKSIIIPLKILNRNFFGLLFK